MPSKAVRSFALLCMLFTFTSAAVFPSPSAAAGHGAPPASTDTVVGVVAAVGCGLGLRFAPVLLAAGAIPFAPVVASCALMIMDGLGTPD